jgi:hypothetical protein
MTRFNELLKQQQQLLEQEKSQGKKMTKEEEADHIAQLRVEVAEMVLAENIPDRLRANMQTILKGN